MEFFIVFKQNITSLTLNPTGITTGNLPVQPVAGGLFQALDGNEKTET